MTPAPTLDVWGLSLVRQALARLPDLAVLCFDGSGYVVDVLNTGDLGRDAGELLGASVMTELWSAVPWSQAGHPQPRPRSLEWHDRHTDAVFAVDLVPIVEPGGLILGGIATARDVTARKRSVELARAVFDGALDAIVIVDDDQRYVDANEAACRLLGYSREELLAKSVSDVVPPGERRDWDRFLQSGSLTGHVQLRCAHGKVRTAEFRSKAHVVPGRHLSILRDATERQYRHERLREAQALFEGAFDAASLGMAMVDLTHGRSGVLTRVNPALAALLGTTPAELVGCHPLDLMHPDDRDEAGAARLPAPGQPIRTAPRVRRADGTYAWTEITTTLVRGPAGPDYMLAVVVDTSARRLAEERLRASEQRFRTLVESSREGVWVLDADDRLTFHNPRLTEMLGDGAEALFGRPAEQLVVDEDVAGLALALETCRSGEPDRRELRLACAGSRQLPVIVSLSPLSGRDGRYRGAMATVTDISEHVAAERERELVRGRLEDRQRLESVGRLAGGIAHEFNNLLGVILNFAGFLEAELEDHPDLQGDLGQIRTAAERAVGLTRQLLTFSRQDLAAPQPVDLSEVVQRAEQLLRPALAADVAVTVRAVAGPCVVHVDLRQIEQVLLNLAINAGEAMPAGGELTIELASTPPWVQLRVCDTGLGMTADVAARAFEPFFSTKSDAHGVGLGLASVFGIVAECRGHVDLESHVGAGTTVIIRLPAVAGAMPPAAGAEDATDSATVLLVEDEPAVRELAERLLRRAGFAVIACQGPTAALARPELADGGVDVLLTDLLLPEMTGEQLAVRVRERYPAVAVALMSGHITEPARDAVVSAQVEFVQKPFTGDELVAGVRRALGRQPGA